MKRFFLALIFGLYVFTRLFKLMELPIFIDEAFYLLLGDSIKNGSVGIWESFNHGNPPFFSWYLAFMLSLIKLDPLIVGRLFSVVFGLLVILLLFFIGKKYFSERVGIFSVFIYTLLPFPLIYDRLTLIEPLVQLLGVVLLGLLLEKKQKLGSLLTSGVILGLSLITKSSSYFYVFLVFILLSRSKNVLKNLLVVLVVSFTFWLIIRLNPNYNNLTSFNLTFTASLNDLLSNHFKYLYPNFIQALHWLLFYFGFGLLIANVFGFVYFLKQKNNIHVSIMLWIMLVIIGEIMIAKIFYPRYLFFITAFLSFTTALVMDKIMRNTKSILISLGLFLVVLLQPIYNSINILSDIENAGLPEIERWQFLEGWPAGYGVSSLLHFVSERAKDHETEFIVERYGLPYFTLSLYQQKNKNVKISNTLPASDVDNDYKEYLFTKTKDKFVIINQLQKLPDPWPLKLINTYPKVNNKNSITIYQLINNE